MNMKSVMSGNCICHWPHCVLESWRWTQWQLTIIKLIIVMISKYHATIHELQVTQTLLETKILTQ